MTIILTVLIAMSLCALLVMCVNCMLGTCHGICKPYFLGRQTFSIFVELSPNKRISYLDTYLGTRLEGGTMQAGQDVQSRYLYVCRHSAIT